MSTITSPRPSTSLRSPSSTRPSFEAPTRAPAPPRRNRAALRDYYGLKPTPDAPPAKKSSESTRTQPDAPADANESSDSDSGALAELDAAAFDAPAFVANLLAREGLPAILKVEADLVAQMRNLDSDRKSLVYDNYSKLLAATSTIRRMRSSMDPLAPTTHTLGPAIAHIAETAAVLSGEMQGLQVQRQQQLKGLGLGIDVQQVGGDAGGDEAARRERERERGRGTVRWVLDTPRRIQEMVDQEEEEEAEREWESVSKILDKWEGVAGVVELRAECEAILNGDDDSESA